MPTWSANLNTITMRSECAIGNAIEARPVETQKRFNLRRPMGFRKKMANATQITFAFFADCSHKQDRTFQRYLLCLNYLCEGNQSRETTAIVCNSRSKQFFVAPGDGEVCVF